MHLDRATADKVFEAACQARFHPTGPLGMTAQVFIDEYTYRICITDERPAHTDLRAGWGDAEEALAEATPEQDRALREAITSPA
ncbi:hypothetical protein [Streptomyces sp. NPDC127100]|uniref:hypothetical protein n=1 Tax=Streptomyces sp. NPDC127100 TaxID=3347138 RepID=UPI0036664FB8